MTIANVAFHLVLSFPGVLFLRILNINAHMIKAMKAISKGNKAYIISLI
jgi:hypothetical protein